MENQTRKSSRKNFHRTKSNADIIEVKSEESEYTPPSERLAINDSDVCPQGSNEKAPDFYFEATQSPRTKVRSWIKSSLKTSNDNAGFVPLSEAHSNCIYENMLFIRSHDPLVNKVVKKPSNIMLRETYKDISEQCEPSDDSKQLLRVNSTIKLKSKLQNLSSKKCSHNGAILTDQKSDNCVVNHSPENSKMREFYSYLKIDTNPSARKLESVHTQRRSKRVQRQVLATEKQQLEVTASKVQISLSDKSSHAQIEHLERNDDNMENTNCILFDVTSRKRKLKDDLKYKLKNGRTLKIDKFSPDSSLSLHSAKNDTVQTSVSNTASEQIVDESNEIESQLACKLFYQSAISLRNGIRNMKSLNFDEVMQQYINTENLVVPVTKAKHCSKWEKENVDCNTAVPEKAAQIIAGKVSEKYQSQNTKKVNGSLLMSTNIPDKVNGVNNNLKVKTNNRYNKIKDIKDSYRRRANAATKNLILKYSRRSLRSSPKIRGTHNSWNSLITKNNRSIRLGRKKTTIFKLKNQNIKNNNAEDKGDKQSNLKKTSVTEKEAAKEKETVDSFSPIKIVSASDFTKFEEIKLANIKINDSEVSNSQFSNSPEKTDELFSSQESGYTLKSTFKHNLTKIILKLNEEPESDNSVVTDTNCTEALPNFTAPQTAKENISDDVAEITSSCCLEEKKIDSSGFLSMSSSELRKNGADEIFTVDPPNTKTSVKENSTSKNSIAPSSFVTAVTNCETLHSVSSSSELSMKSEQATLVDKCVISSTSSYKTSQSYIENTSSCSSSEEFPQIVSAAVSSNYLQEEIVDPQTIPPKQSKYVPLSDAIEPKSLHKSLVHTKRPKITPQEQLNCLTNTQSLFDDFECPKSPSTSSLQTLSPLKVLNRKKPQTHSSSLSAHSVHLLEDEYGAVLHATYLDHHLILAQQRAVGFWNHSALGHVLGAQNMWVPRGRIQRLVLGNGCVNRISKEMSVACDESIAYLELWTKEHKSEKREQPIADVFVTVYFCRRKEGKKVLQLENIKGSADSVQYVVMKHSRNVVVSWRMVKGDESTTLIRSYILDEDFQTVKSTKEMKSVDNYVVSLHNIDDCDTLVMGAGENNINIWNLEYGCLVATVQLQKMSYQPFILWANCDRGYLFVVQQFSGNLLQLVAINGLNYNWKSLQTYRPPVQQNQRLQGIAINGGILVGFFSSEVFCWNMQTGRLLLSEKLQPDLTYIPGNQHVIVVNEDQVQVREILSHILTN